VSALEERKKGADISPALQVAVSWPSLARTSTLFGDDFVRLDLAGVVGAFVAAQFPLDLHLCALGDVADGTCELAPRCDAVPFREPVRGFRLRRRTGW